MLRVAINGFGRIGRNILRSCYENGYNDRLKVVAINDLGDAGVNAHLLRFDSTHGPFSGTVESGDGSIRVNGDDIRVLSEKDPALLPWGELDVDLVMECTGRFTKRRDATRHLEAGAGRILLSAPGEDADAMVVYGVNHQILRPEHRVVSAASCTTNCLAPVAQALHRELGIESGLMTTIHAYTNDQHLIDDYHKDLHRARSATQSMIPTSTGAARAIGRVIPALHGRLDGLAVRVPVINVSLVDLAFKASRHTSVEEVNDCMRRAARDDFPGILAINELPLVSTDFNHNSASSIFDTAHTRVIDDQVKILAWYDNEWAYSTRMLDNALILGKRDSGA
jgi:glyceraldehyde 3-phosphate dehydrogenase